MGIMLSEINPSPITLTSNVKSRYRIIDNGTDSHCGEGGGVVTQRTVGRPPKEQGSD